jgi:hypothetical protein
VLAAVIAIGSGDTLKAADLPDSLFGYNPKLRKGAMVIHILWRARFATRLATWLKRRSSASRVKPVHF